MPKLVIVGPALSGKTTLARGLAGPGTIIFDDCYMSADQKSVGDTKTADIPNEQKLGDNWIYIVQTARQVPLNVQWGADATLTHTHDSPQYAFRSAALDDSAFGGAFATGTYISAATPFERGEAPSPRR